MTKKKHANQDEMATKGDIADLKRSIIEVTDIFKEVASSILDELRTFRSQQERFNKEITQKVEVNAQKIDANTEKIDGLTQKVDMNTSVIQSLDKRVRYQDDMPERLEHVESQQYELTRRVTKLEAR